MTSNIMGAIAVFGRFNRRIGILILVFVLPGLGSCSLFDGSRLDAIKHAGVMTVLTFAGTTTYYETPDGPAGFEYDLAKAFADQLGVKLRVVVADNYADVLPRLLKGEADFAAANIADSEPRRRSLEFTPPYHQARQQVIYRLGTTRPANVQELIGREIEIPAGSRYAERLNEIKRTYPGLKWIEAEDRRTEEQLQLVWEGLLDLTIADSNVFALNRQYFPELQVAFELQKPEPLVWALRPSKDTSIYNAAVRFLDTYRRSGALAQLIDRHYGPASRANFINLTVYRARVYNRLPLYQQLIEDTATEYQLDWRLLAAVAYQESYWDPKSVSYTGVRGFMMLAGITAKELGVADRHDPAESIEGGARYLRALLDRLPERIEYPDRLWMALAAYNVGFYHLEDARILTQQLGGNPHKWHDVRQRLPLLADPKWHTQAKFGYCRGDEPVRFVDRVRVYHDVLVKMVDEEKAKRAVPALKLHAPAI